MPTGMASDQCDQLLVEKLIKSYYLDVLKILCLMASSCRYFSEIFNQVAAAVYAMSLALMELIHWTFFRWMYWTDWEEDPKESKRGKIEKAWMDGTNRNILLTSKTVLWPNGLSLDIPHGILYWVDAYYDRIEMVYLNSTERKVSSSTFISSLQLFSTYQITSTALS